MSAVDISREAAEAAREFARALENLPPAEQFAAIEVAMWWLPVHADLLAKRGGK